ncbi:hypothetical protein [uncultured Methanobrevibacter sp.]|uniref:hypothetical protein n=1 Tax=uncultured Methanobrevibacter sp. TaxID=253161 RepID=UPI0025F4F6C9|nr:hypothetical protein [uncultured Methanobrevibacter sp.]
MKLKNSCILLIVMALFLLVSIGSACAADTGTSDTGILTDDSTSVTPVGDTAEKIDTTVESENVKISENDSVDIPVTVKDKESKSITISKENITVKEGTKAINFNYNNSKVNIVDKLTVGNHSLSITYLGNAIYKNSTKNITLSIFGDKTLKVPSSVGSDGSTVEIPVVFTDGVTEYALNKDKMTLNILYDDSGNKTSKIIEDFSISDHTIKFALENLKYIGATLNINYTEAKDSKNVIIKYATEIKASDVIVREEETKKITVTVFSNGKKLNVTQKDLKVIEGTKELKFNYANDTVTFTDTIPRGKHNLIIKYIGNDTLNESSKNIAFSVYGNLTVEVNTTKLDINSTKKGEFKANVTNGVNNTAFTADDITLNVVTKIGNSTTTINVKTYKVNNGVINFELEKGDFSSANLTITYKKNGASKTITLNRIYNVKIETVALKNEYQSGEFKFKLVDLDDATTSLKGKTLSLYTTGNLRAGFSATADDNNIVSFKTANLYEFDNENNTFEMRKLEVGKHRVELSTSDNIKSTKINVDLTITKATINIKIEPFKEPYGTKKNVTITVTSKNYKTPVPGIILNLYMPQTSGKNYYFQTDANGQSKISVTNLIGGVYDITVSNNDTKNINNVKTSGKITIIPPVIVITAKNSVMWYNTGITTKFKVTDKKTGKPVSGAFLFVKLYTGKKYKAYLAQSNSKGIVQFSAPLSVGKHKMVIQNGESRYRAVSVTKYITVKKASATIKAPRLNTYHRDKYFTVTLTNAKNKKPIYDAKINIKLYVSKNRYYSYKGATGGNGQIKLSLDNLKPGTYKVVVSRGESKNFTAKTVTTKVVIKKTPTKLTPKATTAKKGAKKYFQVVAKNTKTKKAIIGLPLKLKVYTGKTYKTYKVKTNSKGIGNLNLKSLSVGTHKVVVSSGDRYCIAKTVSSTIKITK